jgi:enoyl-CoA hydratase/carnithine racemase
MSSTVTVGRMDDVAIVRMTADENRLNPTTLGALLATLDDLEQLDNLGALVLTGEGKYFSLGLDLEWMLSAGRSGAEETLRGLQALLARLLAFPLITVAAINGHAFAGGAIISVACDQRVMRDDRGYWCLSEVNLGLVFPPAIAALLMARMSPPIAHEAMVTGRRYTAPEALAAGIVDEVVSERRVLEAARERAAALVDKPRVALAAIKQTMYGDVLAALEVVPELPWELTDAVERMAP